MNGWVLRGVGMALVHFVARLVLALAAAAWPTQGSILRTITLVAVILVAVIWGGLDGIRAYRRSADAAPVDLTMLWLKASVVAGVLGGLVSWLFSAVSNIAVSNNTFFFEITSGAAFTILLVFVPATIAVAVGRFFAGRDAKKDEDPRPGKTVKDREPARVGAGSSASPARGEHDADTEVFAPVRTDDARTTDADSTDRVPLQKQSDTDARRSTWQEPS